MDNEVKINHKKIIPTGTLGGETDKGPAVDRKSHHYFLVLDQVIRQKRELEKKTGVKNVKTFLDEVLEEMGGLIK